MRIARQLARIRGPVAFWGLAGVALLVSHDAVFLAQIGPGEGLARSLREAGHDYWGLASVVLALIGLATLAGTLSRLGGLRRTAAQLGAQRISRTRLYATRWAAAWLRLLAVVAIGFGIQENVEHLLSHGHAPGLGALVGPEFPLAMPVIAFITGLAALVAAALGQAEHALLAVIADALRRFTTRAPRSTPRPPQGQAAVLLPPLARAWAGRAPPLTLVSAS